MRMVSVPRECQSNITKTLATVALSILSAAFSPLALAAEGPATTCTVDIRLVGIACERATDNPDAADSSNPRGEYYLRLDAGPEIGPFELRSGESSTFTPGQLLTTLDTGLPGSDDADEQSVPILFHLTLREDDTSPSNEDGEDDYSTPVRIHETVTCPSSTTSVVRIARISSSERAERKRQIETVKVALKLIAHP